MNTTNASSIDAEQGTSLVGVVVRATINTWVIASNSLIVLIVLKTPELKGFSGKLKINQAIADLLQFFFTTISFLVDFLRPGLGIQLRIALYLMTFAVKGVAIFSLCAMAININRAICKPQRYKVSPNLQKIIISTSWFLNIGLVSLYYIQSDLFSTSEYTGRILFNITLSNCWLPLLELCNLVVVPICITVSSYSTIKYTTSTNLTKAVVGRHTQDKLRLSTLIHVTTIAFMLSYVPDTIVLALRIENIILLPLLGALNRIYYLFKICLYIKLFTPFRATAKRIFCRKRQRRVGPIEIGEINTQLDNHRVIITEL